MAEPRRPRIKWRAIWPIVLAAAALMLGFWSAFSLRREMAATPTLESGRSETSENPSTAFEPSDWSLRAVAVVYVGAVILLVVCCLVLIVAYPASLRDVQRVLPIAPQGPLLQTDPQADLEAFRAKEDSRLNTYYWVDKSKGVVHIPIEQAMKQLAASGIPGFPKAKP